MAFLITCEIIIGTLVFARANEIVVRSSWTELHDSATIKLPLLRGMINPDVVNSTYAMDIKKGDRVSIKMGYIGSKKTYENEEFRGFVKQVSPNVPLEIECEDAVFLLRKINLEKTWRQTTLKEVLQYIITEANKGSQHPITLSVKIPEVKFDKFSLDNVNGASALQQIKEHYGLTTYFRDLELFAGLAYTDLAGKVKYSLSWNVPKSNLTYRLGEDVKIKVKAVSILKDNTKLEEEAGDPDGEQRVIFYHSISDRATLKKLATQDISKLKYDGYSGSLDTLFLPLVKHSMTATIIDPDYESRTGDYMVDAVETTFGKGIKRVVTIGRRV